MPGKSTKPRPAKAKRAVPRRELLRRVAVAVDLARDAAASALGKLEPPLQHQALLWIFGHLTGLTLGQLATTDGDHQLLHRLADKAVAAGLDEYLDALQRLPGAALLQDEIEQLRRLSQRLGDELPVGAPRLTLVRK